MPRYAIIDIETTGGMANRDKITEIAIVVHDGEKTIDTYSSLVNPERSIPEYISNLTGITNEMVRKAPKFYEIAKEIVEKTNGAIFVAHSARFDYAFIQNEFANLGYTFSKKILCTVKLGRRLYPGLKSYGLDSIINHLGLNVESRHRALDDAIATAKFFELLYKIDQENDENVMLSHLNNGVKVSKLPSNISIEDLFLVPETCGVYYFYNENQEIVYVGKSINMRKRLMEHFSDKTNKGDKIQQQLHDISYEETGSELISLLLESEEIKKHHPVINRAQKEKKLDWGIFAYRQVDDYHLFRVEKITKKIIKLNEGELIMSFEKVEHARAKLNGLATEYQLCLRMTSIDEKGTGPCFAYHVKKCNGACLNQEPKEEYNDRFSLVKARLTKRIDGNFVIIEKGRNNEEQAVVIVKDGLLWGFGFIALSESISHVTEFLDYIPRKKHQVDSDFIISTYMQKNIGKLKIVQF